MTLLFAVVLGVVQGIAEFLPISSSGHLVIFQELLGNSFSSTNVPLAYDVLLHVATLLVAIWFLRNDLIMVLVNLFSTRNMDKHKRVKKLTLLVIVATVPAVLVVLLFGKQLEASFESVKVCAFGFLFTSLFLLLSDYRLGERKVDESSEMFSWELPTLFHAAVIGCAQAFAIIPGVSRSGSTIAIALILGMRAEAAVRFSFLMFIPAVLGASVKELPKLSGVEPSDLHVYVIGFIVAVIVGSFSMQFLSYIVAKARLKVFALYTFTLGCVLLFFHTS